MGFSLLGDFWLLVQSLLLIIGLHRFSISSWFRLGRVNIFRNVSIFFRFPICWCIIVHRSCQQSSVFLYHQLWCVPSFLILSLLSFILSLLVNFVYLFKNKFLGFFDYFYFFWTQFISSLIFLVHSAKFGLSLLLHLQFLMCKVRLFEISFFLAVGICCYKLPS